MVMINTDCKNFPAATKDSFGGARCICPKCKKDRGEQNPQAEQATSSCLSELLWREVETAPLDGSHILLYRPHIQFTGYYGGANSGWRINAPGLPAMWPLPTHWMPLPTEP